MNKSVNDFVLFGFTLSVSILMFIWLLVLLIPSVQGVSVIVDVHKSVNLTVDDDFARVFVDNAQLFVLNKTVNSSQVFVVGGTNVTDINNTFVSVQLQNVTNVLNYSCNLESTNVALFNLSNRFNDTINATFFRDVINKKNDEMQQFFNENMKPTSDKLLQCQKDLNNLQLQQNSCMINNSFYDNALLQKEVLLQNSNQLKNLFLGALVLVTCLLLLFFFVLFKQGWRISDRGKNGV